MEYQKFPPGSKVKLKTGSKIMTVTGYKVEFSSDYKTVIYNHVICSWEEDGKTFENTFHVDALEAVENLNAPDTISS